MDKPKDDVSALDSEIESLVADFCADDDSQDAAAARLADLQSDRVRATEPDIFSRFSKLSSR